MVQDIYPKVFHNQYTYQCVQGEDGKTIVHIPVSEDYVLIFQDRTIYLREQNEEIYLPRCGEFQEMSELIYLFSIDDRQYFLYPPKAEPVGVEGASVSLPGYEYMKIFEIRRKQPGHRVFAAETAYHLYVWYRDNGFCGRCGQPTVADAKERMLRCSSCGNMIFPKIAPAVIVGVTRGDEILLTTYANREYKRYALIAGFTEIGETAEQTVAREVMEEVGLPVKNIRYYKSQPWGFESDLLLGFYCEVDEEAADTDCIRMDEQELASAEWVKRENMPEYPEEISLTHEMMMRFKYGKI